MNGIAPRIQVGTTDPSFLLLVERVSIAVAPDGFVAKKQKTNWILGASLDPWCR